MYQHQEISPERSELNNSSLGGFRRAIQEFVNPLIQSALAKEAQPPSAPIAAKNSTAGPPKKTKPGELAALPTSQIDQIEDSSQPIIDPSENRKPPLSGNGTAAQSSGKKKSVWPLPPELIDALADGVIEVLPAMQQRLLEEGVISEPILPGPESMASPEDIVPATIGCNVQLRLALNAEGRGAPSYCYFDSDPNEKFCRLVVVSLNVTNRAICSCLSRSDIETTRFFTGVALAKCLLRRGRSALVETLLAEAKTRADIAPNSCLSTAAFARTLAQSALLEPIKQLPIFGQAFENTIGRSFALAKIDVRIPVKALGPPWDRSPSKRKELPPHG
jgi:hypothetical protein